ncbi:MAG TPA: Gfo/Idh/MocA family oxidoreductase [Calditrichia bacterium]|nr:Gfo/Idh/MocA family oxidoreductase [Calditrichota bacterium]HQU71855.1 Gfo/Idh/MocA family oxidoreductase [Calditrichia bacterium]HQV30367.1 Gfo/Idh/MocA family oxidoreductase [Calditrichia bacterium]
MPDQLKHHDLVLVGTGPMAVEYARVLQALGKITLVIGRSEGSAATFEAKTGLAPFTGGLARYLSQYNALPPRAIVAVGVPELAEVTATLLDASVTDILVEKPAGLNPREIRQLGEKCKQADARVYIAYNRRFYASVQKLMKLVEQDGGAQSFFFDFTEWGHVIEKSPQRDIVKANWLIANSSHVIDLAFYLAGYPTRLYAQVAGSLGWHPGGAVYTGAGKTNRGIPFSYHANWAGPGRWGVEVITRTNRYFLRPLEKLARQPLGTVDLEKVDLDDELDQRFKPGLYLQTEAFLKGHSDVFPSIAEHVENMAVYLQILEGNGLRIFTE